jgi:ubiquinone/menaquinone biosynthesis C-methylase UbiE/uncharacterized protein YbaR (Trm112 family)
MYTEAIKLLKCPACGSADLSWHAFSQQDTEKVDDGVVWCRTCKNWYSVENGLLEFLVEELAYKADRENFIKRYAGDLERLGLNTTISTLERHDASLQIKQQTHFDWYAHNSKQSYSDYENTPFWIAADKLAFDPWRKEIKKGAWLLDVGCAQGRSTFKLMDLDIHILGMDVSKHLVRQAIERYRKGNYKAKATFIAADANMIPVIDAAMDNILIYGVLHHLPDPKKTCAEIGRILKPGGIYFGSENNTTIFRKVFDLLQRFFPIWSEEAGPEALISKKYLHDSFLGTGIAIRTRSSVYLPPHLMNLTGPKSAFRWLRFFDILGNVLPFLGNNGGLILIRGRKGASLMDYNNESVQ